MQITARMREGRLHETLLTKVKAVPWRVAISFFTLGVINNVLYVIILSAALDLVGTSTPKSLVLLANILPSVLVKMVAPYVFEYIPHWCRVTAVVGINFLGMILVSLSDSLPGKLGGIGMASAASGVGEITFLQISCYYESTSLAAWSSGTGGAGILGGVLYVASTTWYRVSPQHTLLASSLLPLVMAITYFLILPKSDGPVGRNQGRNKYAVIDDEQESEVTAIDAIREEDDPMLEDTKTAGLTLWQKVQTVKPLIRPYMLPLFLVYFAEYTINQGLSPTMLFDISDMPFKHYRDVYPTYATLYQVGVFISRSSSPFVRVKKLYFPALGQCFLLLFMLCQAIFFFISSINIVFTLIVLEGLLGGLVYVNAFHNVSEDDSIEDGNREFSIGAVGVADSLGILCAALFSLWLEPTVCKYQVADGRPWCTLE